jgi:hypothetical protein
VVIKFCLENVNGGHHAEDLDVDGRIILSGFRKTGWAGVDWIHLAQDRDQ